MRSKECREDGGKGVTRPQRKGSRGCQGGCPGAHPRRPGDDAPRAGTASEPRCSRGALPSPQQGSVSQQKPTRHVLGGVGSGRLMGHVKVTGASLWG